MSSVQSVQVDLNPGVDEEFELGLTFQDNWGIMCMELSMEQAKQLVVDITNRIDKWEEKKSKADEFARYFEWADYLNKISVRNIAEIPAELQKIYDNVWRSEVPLLGNILLTRCPQLKKQINSRFFRKNQGKR